MQKNYPFFETSIAPFLKGIFQKDNSTIGTNKCKTAVYRFMVLFVLALSNYGYAQTETFNSGIPSSWAVTSNLTVTNNWVASPSGGYQSTGGAMVNPASNNTVGQTAQYFLISPQLVTPNNGQIRFYVKQGSFTNKGTTFQLRLSTANQPDISSFNVTLQSWTESQLNVSATTYEEKIVPIPSIPAGIPVYLALVAQTTQTGSSSSSGDIIYVDNFRMIESCVPVTGISTVIASTSTQISWTHPTATQFGIDVVPTGAGHGALGTPVTGTTYNATNLSPLTTYDVYIIANCDASTSSSWAGPFTFTTAAVGLSCPTAIEVPADVTVTPFVYSNNLNQFYDANTYVEYNSQTLACQPNGVPSTWNLLLGNHAYFSFTPATSGLVNISQTANVISGGGGNNCYNASSSLFVFNGCAGVGTSAGCLAGVRTDTNMLTAEINNFYVVAGQTYIFLVSSPYQHTNPGAGICFTLIISGSTCPAPAEITYANLQQTSITASWNNVQNLVSAWEYLALPATSGTPTAAQSGTPTTTNVNNLVSGLSPGVAYNLFVRSVCGGTPGPWSDNMPFTTQCNPLPLPYYTGFTNATVASPEACWSVLNLNNDQYAFTFGNNAFSEPCARLRTADTGPFINDMLVTPQFHFDGVTQKRLRFKYNIYGNWGLIIDNPPGGPGSFEVLLSTSGVGEQDFTTVLAPLASYVTQYNFVEMILPIPANIVGDVNIAWKLPPGSVQTGIQFYVDDVYVEDMPACSEPLYPVITPGTITNTSVNLSWTNGYNNTQWQIAVQPEGTGTPTTGLLVNTNPYTLTGLMPGTRYEIYVRAYCSASEQSIWAGPIYFHTLCDPQPVPYYESLNDDDPNTKKFCWSVKNIGDDNTEWQITATDAKISQAPSFFTPFAGFDDWLVSGPVNAVGLKRLRFNYRVAVGIFAPAPRGNFEVLLSTTPDFSTYTTIIAAHDFTNTGFVEDTQLFTGTGVVYLAFRVPPSMDNPGNSGVMIINDVTIEDAPACPQPLSLNTTASTSSSMTLAWTPGYLETAWEVAVQEPGQGLPTGNGVTVQTTPTYVAGGLQPNTAYEYYVRAVCDPSTKSDWSGPYLFRTDCVVYPSPFIETFEPNSDTKTCWKITDGNSNGDTWDLNSTVNPIAGTMMAAMFTGNNGNNDDWLVSPTITVQPNQRLRFYYKVYDSFFEEDLKVKMSTNGSSTSQFTTTLYENSLNLQTDATGVVAGSNTITLSAPADVRVGDFIYIPDFPFPYPTYVAAVQGTLITMTTTATITQTGSQNVQFEHEAINNEQVKEMIINLTGITAPTDVNFGFYIPYFPPNPWAYRSQFMFIDNFIIEDIPACPSVTNVSSSNIIDTAATIDWDPAGSETSWQVSVQPYGTPAPVGDTLPAYLHTTTTHPYTITGLTPSTRYEYYVRAICGSSSQSEWVGPFEILTKCDYTNVCQYTMSLTSGSTGQVTQQINVMQNGGVVQALEFPGYNQPTTLDYTVFLCTGTEFSLYWLGSGSGVQYSQAQIVIRDEANNVVWTSPLGLGDNNTDIYTGVAQCGVITCPQPTNLAANNQGTLTWTPGGSETQWEVFIQPYQNGTIPQSGIIVNSPSYTPSASDFNDQTVSTYEFLVRAVCGPTNKSYWSGPQEFIRNDEPANAIHLQANSNETCTTYGGNASFIGSTVSTVPSTCEGTNGGDVWFDFVATSKVHYIEIKDLGPGSYYTSSYEPAFPKIMMSVYEQLPDGSLVEKGCSDNNSYFAIYSTELTVGTTYKIRLRLNGTPHNNKTFSVCITTPNDMCDINAFNYDFEKPPMQNVTGIPTIMTSIVVPGWRTNTDWGTIFFQEALNSIGTAPYDGGQNIQITADNASLWNPNDPNIKGLYKDFDTSELTEVDYSFASATRTSGTTLQLYAGPPSGPFTLVTSHFANSSEWHLVTGTYAVPSGQPKTRFIFRPEQNAVGHLIDAANFKAPVNIVTDDFTLDCATTTATLVARGVGHWEADQNNPSVATINTPNSTTTTISGITSPGNYIFHWKTRYCDKIITLVKEVTTIVPTVTTPVELCQNQMASPLTATPPSGASLLWYTQATGGTGSATAPTPATTTVGSTTYYVSAVDASGCEGARIALVVNVNALPTATISGTTSICSGGTATITFNGTPNATVTYTINSGANQTITLNSSGTATVVSPTLTANSTYTLVSVTASGTLACSQNLTGSAIISVGGLPTATISGTTAICSGSTATISFNGTPNATVTYTINSGSNQTIILNGSGTASLTTPALTANSVYTLVSVSNGTVACSQSLTGSATVTVTALPTAAVSGTTTICSGSTATITFTGTPNATVTYTVNSGSNQTIVLDGAGAASVTTAALTATTTYTLVSVNGGLCSQAQTGSAVVTVVALPTATISGTTTICSGGTATITFNGTANAIVTYTINAGSNQTITLNGSGTATLTTAALTATTTYALVSASTTGTTACSQNQTGSAVITITPLPIASISGTTTVCSGATAAITFTGTPNATVTYTVNSGSNQTLVLDGTGTATVTTAALTATTTYALVSASAASCSQTQTGTAVVTVISLPTATISGSTAICTGATAVITFNGTANATVTYTVDGGSNQTLVLDGTGTASITTPALTANSVYTLVSVALNGGSCSQAQTGSATVTVGALPTATISGTTTICAGNSATITFTGTPNATVTYTVDGGTNQTITLNGTGTATVTTPALVADSIYALVSVSNGSVACSQAQTGSAIVTVNALPTATISGTTTICSGGSTTITFNGTPNAIVTYTVDGGSNQTIILDGAGTATLTTPGLTTLSTYTLVSVTTTGTLACTQPVVGSATVTVNALPTASISGTTSVCNGNTAVITFTGTANATVTYTVDGGTNQTITLNGAGTASITTPALSANSVYTLVSVTAAGTPACSQPQTGTATITVGGLPTATISGTTTICSGNSAVITFTGTPNATVTYTVNSGGNQTIVLDGTGTASITTPVLTATSSYTLVSVSTSGATPCSQAQTGTAIVTVNPLPTGTISGTTTICTGTTAVITFTGTPNTTVTYTVNGGSNQTIVLNGAGTATLTTPALTATTTYTLVSVSNTTTSCSQLQTGSAVVTVNALTTPNLGFSYAATCLNATSSPLPIPTNNFVTGGVYSSTTVTVNSSTGAVSLAGLTAGSYDITYTVLPNTSTCTGGGTYTATIVLSAGFTPETGFSYDATYCANAGTILPTLAPGFYAGGVYSSTTGLSINSATGEIDTTTSTPNTYTVTYTVAPNAANCNLGGTSTWPVTISSPLNYTVDDFCQNRILTLQVIPTASSFDANTVNYTWIHGTNTVGTNASTFNVDEFITQNPTMNLPLTFTVAVESNGCVYRSDFTVTDNPCKLIPKGISPNGDQLNDTFDLSGMGVTELEIFNRYGTKVYSYSGNYTNQWNGSANNGNDLPDGTYFYVIRKSNDAKVTGWVYINREY
jgi:gliding motility-associated-like protein